MTQRTSTTWLFLALGFVSCAADVVLGIDRDDADAGVPLDGGSADAGVQGDGGTGDGGALDAGAPDASADAGPDDAGTTTDAGVADASVDAGLDAGAADAGAPDAGAVDAGAVDAGLDGGGTDAGSGFVDLTPFFSGAVAVERGDLTVLVIGARNLGTAVSPDASVAVTIPTGLSFRSGAACVSVDPQRADCLLGDVPAGGVATASLTLAADAGLGWRNVRAQLRAPLDVSDANDVELFPLAITGVGTVVVPVSAPRLALLEGCIGTNLVSFSQCTPGALITSLVVFSADGGCAPEDGGYEGAWGQAAHRRNIGFRFFEGPFLGRQYAGAATTTSCFEGVGDVSGLFNTAAFRLCLQ